MHMDRGPALPEAAMTLERALVLIILVILILALMERVG